MVSKCVRYRISNYSEHLKSVFLSQGFLNCVWRLRLHCQKKIRSNYHNVPIVETHLLAVSKRVQNFQHIIGRLNCLQQMFIHFYFIFFQPQPVMQQRWIASKDSQAYIDRECGLKKKGQLWKIANTKRQKINQF